MTRRTLLLASAALPAAPSSLLDRAITHDSENFDLLRSYVFEIYDRSQPTRLLLETQTYEVNLVGPGMYFRRTAHNDRPLSEQEQATESARLTAHLAQPREPVESPPWLRERALLETWLTTHKFQAKGEKLIDRRPAQVYDSRPPAKNPPEIAWLTNAECRIAFDCETGHWIEANCQITRPTRFELFQLLFGRLTLPYSPGLVNRGDFPAETQLNFRLQRLPGGVWAPKHYRISRRGYLSELTFSKFRKFTSESQLLTDLP